MGVERFQQKLGLPLQLYSPYLCSKSPYSKDFDFLRSNPKLDGCSIFDFQQPKPDEAFRFYEYLFTIGQKVGMVNFELDFLNQNVDCVNEYLLNHTAAATFFDGTFNSLKE